MPIAKVADTGFSIVCSALHHRLQELAFPERASLEDEMNDESVYTDMFLEFFDGNG